MESDEDAALDETGLAPTVDQRRPGAGPLAAATATDVTGALEPAGEPDQRQPERIARYRIQRRLGAGGMGVVYAAHDPELDRTVAIKLVRGSIASPDGERRPRLHGGASRGTPGAGGGDTGLEDRLRREAQALARLSHPNVVSVFDAGVEHDQLYVVMQYVDGASLDAWLAEHQPAAPRVLAIFAEAGRGLAAAHDAGLVHRDFKPSNVLVEASTGAVKVTDFGLARLSHLAESSDAAPVGATTSERALHRDMTGVDVVGTPAYMAPEQFLAGAITPATDQFGFCVSLWEALAGARPFAGKTYPALRKAVVTGELEPPPPGRIPGRILRALRRGLAVRAADRFPDMRALLAAIAPPSRAWMAIAGGAVAAATAGALIVTLTGARDPELPCAGVDRPIDAIWNDPRREGLRAHLAGVGGKTGAERADAAIARLDERAERWRAARLDTCEASRVRRVPAAQLDARLGCLDRSLASFDAALALLGRATAVELNASLAIASSGLTADDCAADQPPVTTSAVDPDLIARAAQIDAIARSGQPKLVVAIGGPLAVELEAAGARAEAARVLMALVKWGTDRSFEHLRELSRRAGKLATEAADHALAAEAWNWAADQAARAGDHDGARDLITVARAAAAQARDPHLSLQIDVTEGLALAAAGDLRRGLGLCERAAEEAERRLGIRSATTNEASRCVADIAYGLHDWARSEQAARKVLEAMEAMPDPEGPALTMARFEVAALQLRRGDREGARAVFDACLADYQRRYGERTIEVAMMLHQIADAESGNLETSTPEALDAARRSLALASELLAADDQMLARVRWTVGELTYMSGDAAAAVPFFQEALAVYEATGDPTAWAPLSNLLAAAHRDLGRCDLARPRLQRVIDRAAAGEVDPRLGDWASADLATCQIEAGEHEAAIARLTEINAAWLAAGQPTWAAEYELWIGEAELRRGRPAAAREVIQRARDRLTGDSATEQKLRARADERLLRVGR